MMSDLSLENKDPIQRLGKNALLQFVTLDYIILKSYEKLVDLLHPIIIPMDPNHKFNNPYQLDGLELQHLLCNCLPCMQMTGRHTISSSIVFNGTEGFTDLLKQKEDPNYPYPTPKPPNPSIPIDRLVSSLDFCDAYRIYIIAITLQRLWSYAFANTRRIYDFKVDQQIAQLQRASNTYGTEDKPNDDASSYFVASLKSQILEELRSSNYGMPVREEVQDILVELMLHIGYLLADKKQRMAIDAEGDVLQEEHELELISELFPDRANSLLPLPILSDLLETSGLAPVFDAVDRYLANEILALINSEILNNLVTTWGALFTESQPEILDILTSLIPTILDRFRMSSTNSDDQQIFRDGAVKFMEDFLQKTILPIRMSDLHDTLDNTSANSALYYFRNLRILVDKTNGLIPPISSPWNCVHNNTDPDDVKFRNERLNFVRLMIWVLSDRKELGEIFAYARGMWNINEENSEFYHMASVTKLDDIVPSAIFQGTLETSDVLPMGGMLIDMNYQRQQKNKDILQSRLGRRGGIGAALKDLQVGYMP